MSKKQLMIAAAQNAMIHVMNLTTSDRVLVITDTHTQTIGEAFFEAAKEFGCRYDIFFLRQVDRPMKELPEMMVEKLADTNVVINAFKAISEETPFRIKWIKKVLATKSIRLGHAPGITESMMIDGPMNVDYKAMLTNAKQMMKNFQGARSVHITTRSGTDITLDITDRDFMTDVFITEEHFGNLPCGEIFNAPVETGASGKLVVDGTIGNIGIPSAPLEITVENGKITHLESIDTSLVEQVKQITSIDEMASVVGELGIGMNPGAKLIGNMLEDEKAFNTAHIAFGNNQDMPGGQNASSTHTDFLFKNPTFVVTFTDGNQRIFIKDGELQL